jgi:hypothetical protein
MTPEQTAALQALEGQPPTMREELERKVTDEVERVILAVRNGKMTAYGYQTALDGLWGGVAGLVSRESMELITEARKAYAQGSAQTLRTVITFGDVVACVRWAVGTDEVTTMIKKPGSDRVVMSRKMEDNSPLTALKYYAAAAKKFRDMPGAQEF